MLPLYDFFHSRLLYTNYSHKIQFITFVLNKLCHLLGQLRRKKKCYFIFTFSLFVYFTHLLLYVIYVVH